MARTAPAPAPAPAAPAAAGPPGAGAPAPTAPPAPAAPTPAPAGGPTSSGRSTSGFNQHGWAPTAGGVVLGALAVTLFVQYARGGPARVKAWFAAKFLNKTSSDSAGTGGGGQLFSGPQPGGPVVVDPNQQDLQNLGQGLMLGSIGSGGGSGAGSGSNGGIQGPPIQGVWP